MADILSNSIPPAFFDDDGTVDQRKCRLLGPTALIVQALMGVFVILSLVLKRHRESPKRPWKIWTFDVSKQVVGQMFVHGVNLLISGVGAHHASRNPCTLYFLNVLIDTTFGVGWIYFVHRFLTHVLSNTFHLKGFRSGQYGTPPSIWHWARQAAVYVTALTTMKLVVIGLFAIPGLFRLGDWLLSWTGGGDMVQVIFVMGLFPIAMNVLQFWLIDSIVKATSQDSELLPNASPRHSADREPLFSATGSDDEDEGHEPTLGLDIENQLNTRSQSQSIRSKNTSGDEQKYMSSRASSNEPEEVEDAHAYPPLSISAGSSILSQEIPRSRSVTPRRNQRKRSPPTRLQLRSPRKNVDFSGAPVIVETETPITGQKPSYSAGISRIDPQILEKLSSVERDGDWTVSWD